jgi:ATP-dependent Clp protease adaptor protein ClpS
MDFIPENYKLTLFNDNHNDFKFIMACLIRFCKHEPIQAEQCAVIADLCGKCQIMSGDFTQLRTLQEKFLNLDIKVGIEVNESSLY